MSDAAEIRKRRIYRVTLVGFAVNLVLSLAKLAAGVFGRSGAMVADAVHSFSDLATDVVVIVFARISASPGTTGTTTATASTKPWPRSSSAWRWESWASESSSTASGPSGRCSTAECCLGPGWSPSWRQSFRSRPRRFSTAIPCAKGAPSTVPASWPTPGTIAATPFRRSERSSA